MFCKLGKQLFYIFIILFYICLVYNYVHAVPVNPGDEIIFVAKNNPQSAGEMECVTLGGTLTYPSFVSVTETFPSTIKIGGQGKLILKVNLDAQKGSKGTISFTLTHNMQTAGMECTPESWMKSIEIEIPDCLATDCDDGDECTRDSCDPETGKCINNPIELDMCHECVYGKIMPINCDGSDECTIYYCDPEIGCRSKPDPSCDIDNSDPTYIQYPRGAYSCHVNETPYQFSPISSPEIKDILEIEYNVPQSSIVTIMIYNSNFNLVKTLANNELRNAGRNVDFWDGYDDTGRLLPDGMYTFIINGVNSQNTLDVWSFSGEIVIDNILPIAGIEFIKADTPEYGSYTIIGTASDNHIEKYFIECLDGNIPVYIDFKKQSSVERDVLGSFNTTRLNSGVYILRLTVIDYAGNYTTHEMPLIISNTTNNLKIHVNSISQSIKSGSEGYVPTSDEPNVWIDDLLPAGSTEMDTWEWDTEIKYSGVRSHTDPGGDGAHGHYFIHADQTLSLDVNENIIQYVYLDPINCPSQIMLQFYIDNGDGEHRAYWGDWWDFDQIPTGGQYGTASLFYMGSMPPAGKWIRLKIPAVDVGLGGKEVKGIAFVTYNGKAYWDKTTKTSNYNETQKASWLLASQIFEEEDTYTIINYTSSQDAHIVLSIYDQANNLIRTLIDGFKEEGSHQIVWDGKDSSGIQAPDGRYYFQFSSPDGPIESNSFALMDGDFSETVITAQTLVIDSQGNTYEIDFDNNVVNKYDPSSTLLFSISNEQVGTESFNPVALELDINDNLFIVDKNKGRIFKLESNGYYLTELPYISQNEWEDKSIALNDPVAILIDEVGDMFAANNGGEEIIKLATARGIIDISNIIAEIRVPYENSLIYATVPIIGTAAARDFARYKVEYGFGESPSTWTTLITSYSEVFDDHEPLPPAITLSGNLATLYTGNLPGGTYTIRLIVYDKYDNYKEDKVRVEVARNIFRDGGTITSNDGFVTLDIPNGAVADDVDLFSIKPVDVSKAPLINNPDFSKIGKIYEIRPPGYQFLKTVILKMYYTDAQLDGIDENTLKIYRWNPIIQRWIFVYADLNTSNNVLTTTLSKFNDYEVYYAIMSGLPSAPVIYQPASPTILKNITVLGKANPSVKVEIFVDGISQGTTQADENTGDFIKTGIQLNQGDNYLTAQVIDPIGNTSLLSDPVLVQIIMAEPTEIASLSFKTRDFLSDFTDYVAIGDFLYIELVGTDADPASVDSAIVNLKSSITDPDGISLQLLETASDSGVYRCTAKVSETSNASSGAIGISPSMVETITVSTDIDPNKEDSLNTIDTVPPPAPTIISHTHPSLCQNTFEFDLGEWANMSNSYGAMVVRSVEKASSGNYSVKLVNQEEGGDFANYIRTSSFDAGQYPVVSFDYKITAGIKLNMVAYVNEMWKEIVFTDDPKTVETFEEDLYHTIGQVENVKADNNWHHAEFNIYNMLKNDDSNQDEYIVEELFFADYDLTGWMELVMGEENAKGAVYYIDNFIITEGGKSNNNPTFTWWPNDSSVVEYSYVLDQYPGTVPDQISEGISNSVAYIDIADGVWYFHVRSLDGGENWGPANHYQIMVDTTGPTADSPHPEDGSSSGSLEVNVHISDGNGSGVNPDTIQIKINETIYDMNSGGLKYDEKSRLLTFSLWKVFPLPDPWLDGETIQASLIAANDFAGNPLQDVFSWSWVVDYSELTGGYLSLLTTQGGYTPTWSPDGTMIAFMSERSGNKDIWIIDANDYAELKGSIQQLTIDAASDHHPAWSPIDDRIAFVSDREGYENIWIINADGTGLTQLTMGDNDDSHPTWSPNGSKIAFSRDGEIWMIDSDGNNEEQVTFNSIEYNLEPVWSPDGTRIVFTKSLYVDKVAMMDTDGTNVNILTDSGYDILPTWSKQTDQIIFVTKRDEKTSAIWIMNSNGSLEENFIDNENLWWDSEPEQSPVDENIAFQSTRNGIWNIWIKTQLQLSDPLASPNPFSPNMDGIKDTTDIAFNLSGGASKIDLMIYDAFDNLVVTLLDQEFGTVGENIVSWDGTDSLGNIVSDGNYTYEVTIGGSAGVEPIEKSGNVIVDTTPPTFSNFSIPDINKFSTGPQNISVTVTDNTSLNNDATQLQYGIAETMDEIDPNIIQWTDFGEAENGALDLRWSNYIGNYLYIRCYAEDDHGNAAYSKIQKKEIMQSVLMYLPKGWSMISLPVIPVNASVSSLFPDAVVVYRFKKGAGYVRVHKSEKLEIGRGYWILLDQNQIYVISGQTIHSYNELYSNTLYGDKEWDLIGGCTSAARPKAENCNIVVIYKFVQGIGYQRVLELENLKPGEAYWIFLQDIFTQANLIIEGITE